jgi:hypothetical protein
LVTLIPGRLKSMVIGWNANAVSHKRVGPRTGRAIGSVILITLDAAWYRQFFGASDLARGWKISSLRNSYGLDPDG